MTTPRPSARCRLDELLVLRFLAPSRARAQALIRSGDVTVDGQRSDKPGMPVRRDAVIAVRPAKRFVGRGGEKLEAALDAFGWDVAGRVALDVGASTGGFTDCLLQRGARHVYAVDVGRGQLAWQLRTDERVTSLERTDIRAIDDLPVTPTLAAVDVAFISLKLVLPAVWRLVAPSSGVIVLIKPQFEAGRADVGRGGVVRDPAVHRRVVHDVLAFAAAAGWEIEACLPSPLTGADGNIEFLAALRRPATDRQARAPSPDLAALIDACMDDARPREP